MPGEILRNIRDVFANIKKGREDVKKSPFYFLEMADIIFSVPRIEKIIALYNSAPEEKEWQQQTIEFLQQRSAKVINTPLCYTLNTEHPINYVCIQLAELCDSTRKFSLLFPTIQTEDTYGNNINSLDIGKFIISDDNRTFLSIEAIIELSCARLIDSETSIYLTVDGNGLQRNITATELNRLGIVYTKLEDIRKLITERSFFSKFISNSSRQLHDELVALRDGLRRGDARHGGQEMNAGADGNVAIVKFKQYYDKLSTRKKAQIGTLRSGTHTLAEIFNLIFRQHSATDAGTATRYCLQIIGRNLESIITENQRTLLEMSAEKQEQIEFLKRSILTEISRARSLLPNHYFNTPIGSSVIIDAVSTHLGESLQNRASQAAILLSLVAFVATECAIRFNANNFNPKTTCYINLLLAIGLESADFPKRSSRDNTLVLTEIIKHIALISSCKTGKITLVEPASKKNWKQYLSANHPVQQLSQAHPVSMLSHINDYIHAYPLSAQGKIINATITNLRAEEAEQKRLAAQRERLRQEELRLEAERKSCLATVVKPQPLNQEQKSASALQTVPQQKIAPPAETFKSRSYSWSFWSKETLGVVVVGSAVVAAMVMMKKK